MSRDGDYVKFGVSVPPEMAEQIERLETGNRSDRIRELIRLGLAAEGPMVDNEFYHPDPRVRADRVRLAMEEFIKRQEK